MRKSSWTLSDGGAKKQYTLYHVSVFILTFMSYSFFHATRKTFSNVKTTMTAEWTASPLNDSTDQCLTPHNMWNQRHFFDSKEDAEEFMGTLDACFLFAYAVGLYVSGFIADRNDLRLVLSIGMALTAVTVFLFGCVFEWLHLYSKPAYIIVWILNGLLQSSGWPSVVAAMGNWFGQGSRGLVMGVWSACASAGNILGALLVSAVLDYGYDYAFLMTASVLLAGAVLNFFGLIPTPLDVGLPLPQEETSDDESDELNSSSTHQVALEQLDKGIQNHAFGATFNGEAISVTDLKEPANGEIPKSGSSALNGNQTVPAVGHRPEREANHDAESSVEYNIVDTRPKAINFLTALLLPGVVPYAFCYAFLKLVNYSFFFWLPFYLANAYSMPETTADNLSIWYDIGGIVGGTVGGFVSDRLKKRTLVVVPMLLISIPLLPVYGLLDLADTFLKNGLLLFALGCFIGGAANLISAAVSADLGRQKALKGNSEALSTVTGILDGTGSLGAALGQVAVPHLQITVGWRCVFYMFMVCTFITFVCVSRLFYQEVRQLCQHRRAADNA